MEKEQNIMFIPEPLIQRPNYCSSDILQQFSNNKPMLLF